MKLSELIAYRNYLNSISLDHCAHEANKDLSRVIHTVETHFGQIDSFCENLKQQRQIIQTNFENFRNTLDQLKTHIEKQIAQLEPSFFVESYRLYEQEMCYETAEYILKRQSTMSYDTRIALQTRLKNYTHWQHAGMIIRPGLETFVYDMVSFDPLYVIDETHELLDPVVKRFPEQYQRRLRPYVINERNSDPMMTKIPDGQFGLCLAFYLFDFRPFEIIKKYLTEIYQKLKPGGVLIITFNDCDREKAVQLVENNFACYTPGYLIFDLAKSLGYEVLYNWNDGGSSTWLELVKPGELTTLKGGQSFAKVVAYPQ